MCECPLCHQQFTTLSAFDSHQQTKYGAMHPVRCLDPAALGMALDNRGRWAWSTTTKRRAVSRYAA